MNKMTSLLHTLLCEENDNIDQVLMRITTE